MHYQVRGLGSDGAILVLEIDARDERDASEQAASRGVAVLSMRRRAGVGAWIVARRARFPLLLFSQELLALLQSGISLVEAIETLAEKEQRPETRKVLEQLITRLRQGQPLSGALQQSPAAFPPLYV
ncbi:MAG: type II secretion system F family protein, partial [Burkholderiales bacterium]